MCTFGCIATTVAVVVPQRYNGPATAILFASDDEERERLFADSDDGARLTKIRRPLRRAGLRIGDRLWVRVIAAAMHVGRGIDHDWRGS